MAEVAVTVVTDRLLSLLADEARLLRSVHTQVEDIKTELLYIQAFLKDADAKAEKGDTSQGVKAWVQELRETAYCIEDLVDEYILHFANRPDRRGVVGFLCKCNAQTFSFKGNLVSRPKTHSKGVTVISHLKPEGLKYNLTQTVIL